jgi:hypothetical protein
MRATDDLRERILAQLADIESLRIIASVLNERKTAIEIGKELGLPSTTLYRKVSELKECGLLTVDTFGFRPNGKREAQYGCAFSEIVLRTTSHGLELELIPSRKSQEKRRFELLSSKDGGASPPGRP